MKLWSEFLAFKSVYNSTDDNLSTQAVTADLFWLWCIVLQTIGFQNVSVIFSCSIFQWFKKRKPYVSDCLRVQCYYILMCPFYFLLILSNKFLITVRSHQLRTLWDLLPCFQAQANLWTQSLNKKNTWVKQNKLLYLAHVDMVRKIFIICLELMSGINPKCPTPIWKKNRTINLQSQRKV